MNKSDIERYIGVRKLLVEEFKKIETKISEEFYDEDDNEFVASEFEQQNDIVMGDLNFKTKLSEIENILFNLREESKEIIKEAEKLL